MQGPASAPNPASLPPLPLNVNVSLPAIRTAVPPSALMGPSVPQPSSSHTPGMMPQLRPSFPAGPAGPMSFAMTGVPQPLSASAALALSQGHTANTFEALRAHSHTPLHPQQQQQQQQQQGLGSVAGGSLGFEGGVPGTLPGLSSNALAISAPRCGVLQ